MTYYENNGRVYEFDHDAGDGFKKISKVEYQRRIVEESKHNLAEALSKCTERRNGKPIIRTVLRSVSRSGMSRVISVYVVQEGTIKNLSWDIANAMGQKPVESMGWAVKVGGCGMDMGYHLADLVASYAGVPGQFTHEWM